MGILETYSALLQNYTGRDKVLRTVGYTSLLLTGAAKGKTAENLTVVSKQMSTARLILRLFDGVPMWTVTRKWGAEEKDPASRICTVIGNVAIQLYFPCEMVGWLSNNKILSWNSRPWWDAGIACWAVYLVFSIIRGIRQVLQLRAQRRNLLKQQKLECPDKSGDKYNSYRQQIRDSASAEVSEYWTLVKNMSDLVMAINWLPMLGVLWAGKLSPPRTAFFGTISSLIGLAQSVKRTQASMKQAKTP